MTAEPCPSPWHGIRPDIRAPACPACGVLTTGASSSEPTPTVAGRKPNALVYPCVRVVIAVPRTPQEEAAHRLLPDDGTIAAFMAWCLDARILPLRGGSSSGPGFYDAVFAATHAEPVRRWLREHDIPKAPKRAPGGQP